MSLAPEPQPFITRSQIEIPLRPENQDPVPDTDRRHWYRYEYEPWTVRRRDGQPLARPKTVTGASIWCLLPGEHPYFDSYVDRLRQDVTRTGATLTVRSAEWEADRHFRDVQAAVAERPDLVIYVADEIDLATVALEYLFDGGIPVIGSNMPLTSEAMELVVAWTGPDSWAQSRALARRFADSVGRTGGYAVIGHVAGTSIDLARTWGIITELTEYAPAMRCLAIEPGVFDAEAVRRAVQRLVQDHGRALCGIVSSDDNIIQRGVMQALHQAHRQDIKTAAHGSTSTGIRLLEEGELEALTYQSARADASIAAQAAIDWLSGLEVERARFLPVYVIDRSNLQGFRDRVDTIGALDWDVLEDGLFSPDSRGIQWFFATVRAELCGVKLVTQEYVRGVALEILFRIISYCAVRGVPEIHAIGSYEEAARNLLRRRGVADLIGWLEAAAERVRSAAATVAENAPLSDRLVALVDQRYAEPISLKTLANELSFSPQYLGRVFHDHAGVSFSTYLNSIRIEKARESLRQGSVSAARVAQQVGFSDPNYFYRVFKRVTGQSVTSFIESFSKR